jgi:hypothetical protein
MKYLAVMGAVYLAVKTISVIHSTHFIEEFIPRKKQIQADPAAAKPRPQPQDPAAENSQ